MSEERWQAGRALDAEIARRIFGVKRLYGFAGEPWDDVDNFPLYIPSGKPWRTHSIDATVLPWFSQDIAPAWQIVEWLSGLSRIGDLCVDLCVKVGVGDGPFCEIFEKAAMGYVGQGRTFPAVVVEADTAPLAICRAALAALDAGGVAAGRRAVRPHSTPPRLRSGSGQAHGGEG